MTLMPMLVNISLKFRSCSLTKTPGKMRRRIWMSFKASRISFGRGVWLETPVMFMETWRRTATFSSVVKNFAFIGVSGKNRSTTMPMTIVTAPSVMNIRRQLLTGALFGTVWKAKLSNPPRIWPTPGALC
jgi:hypothetical protein